VERIEKDAVQAQAVEAARFAQLEELIMRLLEKHKGTFFSPLRLRNWGSRQDGFAELAEYSKEQVTKALSEGVSKRGIKVMISLRVNTLYGLPRRKRA
jgi:hypothetical protein